MTVARATLDHDRAHEILDEAGVTRAIQKWVIDRLTECITPTTDAITLTTEEAQIAAIAAEDASQRAISNDWRIKTRALAARLETLL